MASNHRASGRFTFLWSLAIAFLVCLYILSFSGVVSPPRIAPAASLEHVLCNYSSGGWLRNAAKHASYDQSCPDIFKGWNCARNQKHNSHNLVRWQWFPSGCNLPPLDALVFAERFRNKSVGFVGDSLNRNMYISMVCSLRRVAGKAVKFRPSGADRGLVFPGYNLTVAYHRTNLLAKYGRWKASNDDESLKKAGFREGYRVDVDVPQSSWSQAPKVHQVLVFNTGHWWWAREKFDPVTTPLLFFQGGKLIVPLKSMEEGLDLVLQHMIKYVEIHMASGGLKYFRTQSPTHFSGGDWKDGGSCTYQEPLLPSQVDSLFGDVNNLVNREARLANHHLARAVEGTSFLLLDITGLSEYRADAHPSISGGKQHEDCMHWCLPGLPDSWNDLLVADLLDRITARTRIIFEGNRTSLIM